MKMNAESSFDVLPGAGTFGAAPRRRGPPSGPAACKPRQHAASTAAAMLRAPACSGRSALEEGAAQPLQLPRLLRHRQLLQALR